MALMLKSNLLVSKKNDRSILFNDILNTFHLWLYGIGHMIKAHSGLGSHFKGYSFQSATRILYMHQTRQDSTCNSICYTSCGALAGTRNRSLSPLPVFNPLTHQEK